MNDKLDRAYDFVKRNGPVLPIKISKSINTNVIMASAVLSVLVSDKKVKLTHENIGGSPLYYVQGQETRLQDTLGEKYNGVKREAYLMIKENKVLRDGDLSIPVRLALREMKDFAVPLDVNIGKGIERYWRWYLINNNQVKEILIPKTKVEEVAVKEEIVKPNEVKVKKKTEDKPKLIVQKSEKAREEPKIEVKQVEVKEEEKEDVKTKIGFYNDVDSYFTENKVIILKEEIVKRDKDFNFVVEIPSSLGNLKYFVKVRNKKKISDADLSLAFSQAQQENLPMIFLTNGEITKKAKEILEKNLKGVVFKKF
ncbi:MAG: hypothetical protein HYS32_01300 [Candidatus Woesearchaeota archaeon]|nr:MAG: hypothetical protein HYS32_01300 [Candidatus Woesearchaeota archaeon]